LASSLQTAREAFASPAFQAAAANWAPTSLQRIEVELPSIQPLLDNVDAETVADPDTALGWVAEDLDEIPDGWDAIPGIWSTLTPGRRRELRNRVLALLVAVYVYAAALATETEGEADMLTDDAPALVGVWVMLSFLYSSVVGAIEDAEEKLRE
jgi:hypothetical protein